MSNIKNAINSVSARFRNNFSDITGVSPQTTQALDKICRGPIQDGDLKVGPTYKGTAVISTWTITGETSRPIAREIPDPDEAALLVGLDAEYNRRRI